ncbi:MAG: RNA polymerase sigma factor [Oscillospiraceae bacterium]|nr:RNA polymerase sigma factor [Oscillospiraceae bacterium]
MDEMQLYELMRTEPERGMKQCIEQYYALVSMICGRILKNYPQDKEECVNTSFLRLWQTLDRLEDPHHLRAYLCCISRNTALSRYRRLKKEALPAMDACESAGFDFLQLIDRRADSEALQRAIMSLKEPEREIFVRKYYHMESMKTLAKHFGVSVKTIDNILYRTKCRLREILKGEIGS